MSPCCLLLGLYIHHEWRYDRHHPKADRIYRIVKESIDATGKRSFTNYTPGALNDLLLSDISGIESGIRYVSRNRWVKSGDTGLNRQFAVADPRVLDVFDFHLVVGNRATALSEPKSVLITESAARAFFGDESPIGRHILAYEDTYTVTGVLRDLPKTSLVQLDFLAGSIPHTWTNSQYYRRAWQEWGGSWPVENYVVLREGIPSADIERQIGEAAPRVGGEAVHNKRFHLQPIVRAHLHARQDFGVQDGSLTRTQGDIRRLYVAAVLAAFILALAATNFVNLTTARSSVRAKEVGMRKVVGAQRHHIATQFLGESVLLAAAAHAVGLGMAISAAPALSALLRVDLALGPAGLALWLIMPISSLVLGILAGWLPSVIISRFSPIAALKGRITGIGGAGLRKGLVLFQFAISILLIAGTSVVFRQWEYMVNKDTGYDKENVILLRYPAGEPETVRQQFLDHPDILHACVTNNRPIYTSRFSLRPEGWTDTWSVNFFDLDTDVLNVLGIELLQGRDYRVGGEGFLINETAAKMLGWSDPVGRTIYWVDTPFPVIGVVRDFHFESVQSAIRPLVMGRIGNRINLSLRVRPDNLVETMAYIEKTWKKLQPDRPFTFQFLDEEIERLYRSDLRASQMFSAAATLAIVIACLGLIGLASFNAQQRTKEIGIRKVLGATVSGLIALFTHDFLKLVVLANVIAIPASVYFAQAWLSEFAYRIEPGIWPFLLGAGLSIAVAVLTVGAAAFRPATRDPVVALRTE